MSDVGFEQRILDGLERLEAKIDKLTDQGNDHKMDIGRLKDRVDNHELALRGPDGTGGILAVGQLFLQFKSTLAVFAAIGGAVWLLVTVLAGVVLTNYLDTQAKLREAMHAQEMATVINKIQGGQPTVTVNSNSRSP